MRWQEYDDPGKQKELLEESFRQNRSAAHVCYELGSVYAYMYDWAAAKELCDNAVELDPTSIIYRAFRSYVNSHLEEHGEAIRDLVAVIELGGDETDYYVDMAQAAQCGLDKECALRNVTNLRNDGKNRAADKLEEWLVKPFSD